MNHVQRSRLITLAVYLASVLHSLGIVLVSFSFCIASVLAAVIVFSVAAPIRVVVWLHEYPGRRRSDAADKAMEVSDG